MRLRLVTYNLRMSSGGYLFLGSLVTSASPSGCDLCSIINLCSMYISSVSLGTTYNIKITSNLTNIIYYYPPEPDYETENFISEI